MKRKNSIISPCQSSINAHFALSKDALLFWNEYFTPMYGFLSNVLFVTIKEHWQSDSWRCFRISINQCLFNSFSEWTCLHSRFSPTDYQLFVRVIVTNCFFLSFLVIFMHFFVPFLMGRLLCTITCLRISEPATTYKHVEEANIQFQGVPF